MSETWSIRRVLDWTARDFAARGIDTARLDAELLVAHALGLERVGLYLDLDRPLQPAERERIRALVKRRRDREPVAYILGRREFYGRTFEVGPAVLVPRPDTETLVEHALARPTGENRVLDLCTGSGIVAITLAAEREDLRVDATDLSEEALAVARRNAERHGVADRIEWLAGDLFQALPPDRRYALITANPPYIAEGDFASLEPEVARWEPRIALAGGSEGLDVVQRIARGAGERLVPGGRVLVEVGAGQAPEVARLFEEAGLVHAATHRDIAGIERVVEATASL
ncbi:MAG: peptide chain release factor N(5)-glutamine methyltransferase [Myxococcota bacterium]